MTSPASTAEEALTRLYAAANDRQLAWLDDLTVAAGLRRQCANCHAITALDGCDQCGTPEPAQPRRERTRRSGRQRNEIPDPAVAQNDPPTWALITREQAASWAGRPLSDEEMDRLDNAIPNSSIPEAIAVIVDSFEPAD